MTTILFEVMKLDRWRVLELADVTLLCEAMANAVYDEVTDLRLSTGKFQKLHPPI